MLAEIRSIEGVAVQISKGNRSCLAGSEEYFIHVTDLPPAVDASLLSEYFDRWPISHILMAQPDQNRLWTECWLLAAGDQQAAEARARAWHGKTIQMSVLSCTAEENKWDVCRFFQIDRCRSRDDQCDWRHVKCSDNAIDSSSTLMVGSHQSYRVKISGFQASLTPETLSQLVNMPIGQCFVPLAQNRTGYVVKLNAVKKAQALFDKWHNHALPGGHRLQCQLELNTPWGARRLKHTPGTSRDSSCSRGTTGSDGFATDNGLESTRFVVNESKDNSIEKCLTHAFSRI